MHQVEQIISIPYPHNCRSVLISTFWVLALIYILLIIGWMAEKFINQYGVSFIELTIALLLTGGLALGTIRMVGGVKGSAGNFEKSINIINLETSIASYLLSKQGCQQLLGIKQSDANSDNKPSFSIKRAKRTFVGDNETMDYTDESGNTVYIYREGNVYQNIKLVEMKVDALNSMGSSDSGVLTVKLLFQTRDGDNQFGSKSKEYLKYIYVPVGLTNVAGDLEVTSCDLGKNQMYEMITSTLCSDGFFSETAAPKEATATNCGEALSFVEMEVKKEICIDITGDIANFNATDGTCNLKGTHAGKVCANGTRVTGFDANGELQCN